MAACSLPSGTKDRCTTDEDCLEGRFCVEGRCADEAAAHPCNDDAAFALADVDGDGRADLVCAGSATGEGWIAVSTGEAFANASSVALPACGGEFGGADFDGDGRADPFCHDFATASLGVWRSLPSAALADRATWIDHFCGFEPSGRPSTLAIGDFDGNGRADAVCHEYETRVSSIALSDGAALHDTGTWIQNWCGLEADALPGELGTLALSASDSRSDLYCHEHREGWLASAHNQSNGVIVAEATDPTPMCGSLALGETGVFRMADFDGNGRGDMLCIDPVRSEITVRLAGANRWDAPTVWTSGACATGELRIADLDGDGRADLACRHTSLHEIAVWRSDGARFQPPSVWYRW